MSSHKNPLSHSFSYYPECSQNQVIRSIRIKVEREQFELNENEIAQETKMLIVMKDFLPDELIKMIGDFSPVVIRQRFLVRFEYFDKWIVDNTTRVMAIVESWSKPHVGFVLNRIIQLGEPSFEGYLKGNSCYTHFTKKHMVLDVKVYISHRNRVQRQDILDDLKRQRTYIVHQFVPCTVNPAFNDLPIRVYGAYRAIEDYDKKITKKKTTVVKK